MKLWVYFLTSQTTRESTAKCTDNKPSVIEKRAGRRPAPLAEGQRQSRGRKHETIII